MSVGKQSRPSTSHSTARLAVILLAVLSTLVSAVTTLASPASGAQTSQSDPQSPATPIGGRPQLPQGAVRIDSETTPTREVWRNRDGSLTAAISTRPVRHRDAQGVWRDIDMTLEAGADGSLRPKNAPVIARLAGQAADTLVTIETPAGAFGLRQREAGASKAQVAKDVVTYPGALPGGRDVSIQVQIDGFKETVTLPNARAGSSYIDEVEMPPGVTARQAEHGVEFVDQVGSVVAGFGDGFAWDATFPKSAASFIPVSVRLLSQSSTVASVEVGVDPSWLSARERAFPVTIDPDFWQPTQPGMAGPRDAFVYGAPEYRAYGFDHILDTLWVGNYPRAAGRVDPTRTFMWFDLSSLPTIAAGATINSSYVVLYNQGHGQSCTPQIIDLYRLKAPWGADLNWYTQPRDDQLEWSGYGYWKWGSSASPCPGAGYQVIESTSMARKWLSGDGVYPNHGLQLRARNEADPEAFKLFVAGDIPSTNPNVPYFYVNYTAPQPPSAPRNVDAQPANGEALVTWTEPSSGPVTHYVVTASPGGYRAAVDANARSAVVPGLGADTPYSFKVVAWNAAGPSPGSTTRQVTPFSRTGSTPIAAGAFHSLSVLDDGTVWSIGNNDFGQLGDGTRTATTYTGVRAAGLAEVGAVAAGDNHSLALDVHGTVWAWGSSSFGQLGDETLAESLTPTPVFGRAQAVAAGGRHSLALATDGTVWAWGANESGQLGSGGTTNSAEPVPVVNLANVKAVAANGDHSLALTADGSVWAWGANGRGQLGNGSTQNSSTPVRISSLTGMQSVSAGRTHSLAIAGDGAVWSWGANTTGQLGNNSTADSSVPVRVLNIAGATSVAGGDGFSLALLSDGSTHGWGLNDRYQLGTNDTISTRTPVPVENQDVAGQPTTLFLGATAIAAGKFHGFAVTSAGRIYEWGIHPGPGNVCQGAFEQSKPQDRNAAQPQRFVLALPPPPELMPDVGFPEFVTVYRELGGDTNAQGQYNKPRTNPGEFKLEPGELGLSVRERASLSKTRPYILPFYLVGEHPVREVGKASFVLGMPNCTAYFRPLPGVPLHWEIECTPGGNAMAVFMSGYAKVAKAAKIIEPMPGFQGGTVLPL
jgi:alpha-tubulin suppressor-like RCC1 family protein